MRIEMSELTDLCFIAFSCAAFIFAASAVHRRNRNYWLSEFPMMLSGCALLLSSTRVSIMQVSNWVVAFAAILSLALSAAHIVNLFRRAMAHR